MNLERWHEDGTFYMLANETQNLNPGSYNKSRDMNSLDVLLIL